VGRVVLADGHDLAGQHGGQQPDVGKRVAGAGVPDGVGGPEGMPGQFGDLQFRALPACGPAGNDTAGNDTAVNRAAVNDAVPDLTAEGKPRYTHGLETTEPGAY
jgi:hypothetical protein